MTATLERRIARLEATPPPLPPDEPDADDLRWWEAAPKAVRAYFLAVEREVLDYYAFHGEAVPEGDELSAWMAARHPLYWTMRLAGEQGYPLRRAQHELLCRAWVHLCQTLSDPGHGDNLARAETAYRRGFGIDSAEGGRRYADHLGAGLVEAWRAHRAQGEPCPSWCRYMGIERAELDFLAADE